MNAYQRSCGWSSESALIRTSLAAGCARELAGKPAALHQLLCEEEPEDQELEDDVGEGLGEPDDDEG